MKYTRLEIYKGITNSKLKVMLGFFILIPIIAVAAGSIIAKIFIANEEKVNFTQYEGSETVVYNQIKTEYKVYFLQAGAFISKNNAEVLKNAIKKDDINPIIVEDNNIYRVIANISDNKEFITQNKDKLKAQGYSCLINEFTFTSNGSRENEEVENSNKFLETSINIIRLQIELNNDFTELDINNLEVLRKYIMDLNGKYVALEQSNFSNELKNYESSFMKYANEYINGYENRDKNICQHDTAEMVLLTNNFYKETAK